MKRNFIIVSIIVVLGIIIMYLLPDKKVYNKTKEGEGEVEIGGDFILIDEEGKEFSSDNLKDKLTLMYFGFTTCPDVCPATISRIEEVLDILDKYRVPVNVVFITVDPTRDRPEVLKNYFKSFKHKFIALTGEKNNVDNVLTKFKVYHQERQDPNLGYLIDHTSFLYLMDKNGKYVKHFPTSALPKDIADEIRVNFNW